MALHTSLTIACLTAAASSQRSVLSYCAGAGDCNKSSIMLDSAEINAVSVTSYYLSEVDGLLHACNSTYADCGWDGSVGAFNEAVEKAANGSIVVEPLIFNNAGKMMKAFHLMLERGTQDQNIAILANDSHVFDYKRVQFDLEPSCWASNASECDWPSESDSAAFASFISAMRSSLGSVRVTVAAGGWWGVQCASAEQYAVCNSSSAQLCSTGQLSVNQCNCCAYTTWFNATTLCEAADVLFDMDTYQAAPLNLSAFEGALKWYTERGCAGKLAVGLLSNQAVSETDAEHVLSLVEAAGSTEVSFWDNLWSASAFPTVWQAPLKRFAAGESMQKPVAV